MYVVPGPTGDETIPLGVQWFSRTILQYDLGSRHGV